MALIFVGNQIGAAGSTITVDPANGMILGLAAAGGAPGLAGQGYVWTSGQSGGGDAQGGDFLVNLGAGSGQGRSGMFIINATATHGTSDYPHNRDTPSPALFVTNTYTPTQPEYGSVEAIYGLLTTRGDGGNLHGVAVEAVEFVHSYQASGAATRLLYGGEATFTNDGPGSVQVATGWQANIRGEGPGPIISGVGMRVAVGPFVGPCLTLNAFTIGLTLSAVPLRNLTGYFAPLAWAIEGGSDTTGGYSLQGFYASNPGQGGNTSGINTNYGFRTTNTSGIPGAGGGTPGVNGTVDNVAYFANVPQGAAAGSGTGRTYNQGIHLVGNGGAGSPGAGGVHNWALLSESMAASGLAGSLMLGVTNHQTLVTPNALQLADSWNIVLGTSAGSKFGTAPTQKLAFWGAQPIVQPILATGAGRTVDDVISVLQSIGLARQAA